MMIVRLIVLPVLAIAGVSLAAWTVQQGNVPTQPTPGLNTPATSPYATRVSATGTVEASSRNIGLGVARPGLVTALPHDIGATVAKGDLLLQIDDRDAQARLLARQAELASARQQLARWRALPRAEEVAPKQAAVEQSRAELQDAKDMLAIAVSVTDPRALSRDERTRREAKVAVAAAALAQAEAQLALVKAGAWAADLDMESTKIAVAEAAVATVQAELEQLRLRAPFAGKVLQVNVRVGEYAGAATQPAIVFGNVDTLHVRADVDEMDVWRLRQDAPARAFLRGNAQLSAPLQFVAIEPLMVPKRALSGSSREQVDTRVLQVIYALDPAQLPVQVGQLVDVFIEAVASGAPK